MADWPLRINISEEDLWAPYDTARSDTNRNRGNVWDWASDNAWDDWRQIGRECLDILKDLVDAYVPKSKAKKISEYDIRRICEAIKDDDAPFEEIRQAFVDAATWAWEEAYTPEDSDLEKALEYAMDEAIGEVSPPTYWGEMLNPNVQGPKDWSPLRKFTKKDFLREIEAGISFEHEDNQWDRFIVFDLMDGPVVKYMRRKLKSGFADTEGELVTVDAAAFETDMRDHFVDPVIHKMGRALDKVMERVEPWQRVDFKKHWKEILRDKSRAKGVEEEILEWLKSTPADGSDDES